MTFRVVIDGANLCKPNDSLPWKLEFVELAIRDITNVAKATDPKRALELKVYIDASTYYKFSAEADKNRFDDLCNEGKIERTPAGGPADLYILKWAQDHQALVVSNDQYKEFIDRHSWIKDPGRSVSAVYDSSLRKWNFMEKFSGKNTPREVSAILESQPAFTGAAQIVNPTQTPATPITSVAPTLATNSPQASSSPQISGAYKNPIKRDAPAAIVLLVDQSGSMGGIWTGGGTKSIGVAESVNNLLESLVLASVRNRGDVYPYFDVAVLGYSGTGANAVRSLLPDTTTNDPIRSIDKIAKHAKVESSTRNGITEDRRIWVRPHHDGQTPMCAAIECATKILKSWVKTHPESFPPIVMNVTDGVSTDGAPQLSARELLSLRTNDGSVLFFNVNISSHGEHVAQAPAGVPQPKVSSPRQVNQTGSKILFPNESVHLPNEAARTLFDMSSVIPEPLRKRAEQLETEIPLVSGARGFVYNATSNDLSRFFDIGTPQNTQ